MVDVFLVVAFDLLAEDNDDKELLNTAASLTGASRFDVVFPLRNVPFKWACLPCCSLQYKQYNEMNKIDLMKKKFKVCRSMSL